MNERGFTFVELLISLGLVAIFIPAIYRALSFSLLESRQGEQFSVAWSMAREGMESIFAQKDSWAWTSTDPINGSTETYPQVPYTRTVTISEVVRGGIPDLTTRKIFVTVSWPDPGGTQTVSLTSYVTKH